MKGTTNFEKRKKEDKLITKLQGVNVSIKAEKK